MCQVGCGGRNRVRDVRRNSEEPRSRYVEDSELEAFLEYCSPFLRAYVGLKMLTGLRQGQLLGLKASCWDGEWLSVPPAKGGKPVKYRGAGLEEVIANLRAHQNCDLVRYIVGDRNGSRYTDGGFRAIWRRAMNKYIAQGGERFRENDLRAKVASDDPLNATDRLGHRNPSTTRKHYQRKPIEVEILRSTIFDGKSQ